MHLLFLLTSFFLTPESDVRALYIKAYESSEMADKLVNTCRPKTAQAFYCAYYASGLGFQAKHHWNPATKLSKAKDAAKYLTLAVNAAPSDFEIRFLRFSYEVNVPGIVGITKHTTDDKKWLLANLNRSHPMWGTIKKFLKDCDSLTQEEKDKI